MTRNRILILLGFLGGLFLAYCILSLPLKAETDIDLSDNKYYIAHAGGGINGHVYTNCKEALIQSLERGYQFIELDFCLTSDRHLVCAHGASVFNEKTNGNRDSLNIMPDLSTFKRRKIHDEYTPITANDVLKIMKERNFTLLLDGFSEPSIVDEYFAGVKNRIMVETQSVKHYVTLCNSGYVPILSMGDFNLINIIKFVICRIMNKKHIEYVTATVSCNKNNLRILKRLFGIKVLAFTCNSKEYLEEYLGKEVDMVYTDSLY